MNPCTVENIELGPGGIHIIIRAHDTGKQYVAVVTHEELELDPPPPEIVRDAETVQLPTGEVEPVTPIDGEPGEGDGQESEPNQATGDV